MTWPRLTNLVTLQQEIFEAETHLHSYERWFELAGTPDTTVHRAVRIGNADGVGAFQIDGAKSDVTPTWGTAVQILGSTDTPADTGMTHYDLHRILFTAAEDDGVAYYVQIIYGATSGDGEPGLTNGTYTELIYRPQLTLGQTSNETPVLIQGKRQPAGTTAWVRCIAVGEADGGTLDFCFGLHEYPH